LTEVAENPVRLSIIVPSYRRADRLQRLVESIAPQISGRADRELIVVDDASRDPRYSNLASQYAGIMRLIEQPKNAGPSAARNAGFRVARGEYLIFIDDDCVAPPYWLDWFDNIVSENPDVDLIGGYARPLPHEKRWTPTRWAPDEYLRLGVWYHDDVVVLCSSCHLAVKRHWYDRIGGFREEMRWAEDRNLTYRLRRAGAIIYTDPAWHVYHETEATLRQHVRRRIGYGRGACDQMAREWPALDQPDWPKEGSVVGSLWPRIVQQIQAMPWYWKRARREKKWPPGYAFMAAITPLAMDWGYVRKRREHARATAGKIRTTPFGTINFGRSGSTLLGDMLAQCPGVDWGHELFNPETTHSNHAPNYLTLKDRLALDRAMRFGFEANVEQVKAIGLAPADFVDRASADGVAQWILLTRRNLLRQHVSLMLASKIGRFHQQQEDFWRKTPLRQIRIDVADGAGGHLLEQFRNRAAETESIRNRFDPGSWLELVYEDDIEADPRRAIARVSRFLGLPDYDPVVRYRPVEPYPLSEIVENFVEVSEYFGGTEYAWMLEG
jgi:glycosyltransferase involved in cell wall biosynthesis